MGVTDHQSSRRHEQVEHTRLRIIVAAERLFAEHGVFSVSNRQVSEAAGQGNNAAVNYHFGTKADLVRAIIRRHAEPMEQIRGELLAAHRDSTRLRDWVTCVVRPYTDHLRSLGTPCRYARLAAQLITEPQLRELAALEFAGATHLIAVTEGLHGCLPGLPVAVRNERDDMAHTLITHLCAQRERGLPENPAKAAAVWSATTVGLIDAIEGLYQAPASIR
ncbi:TetR/AcrR family transcriptional regulator [Actinoplanes sp. L3-i22]|uniref:TetR/AcrR family transcriptional regulator n=1 Tax=Actinoplanes sp. L3-i22 TaxID=2836373 RepID=UPI001C795367|nr:TetR/AcrR family transcriptional regulator [Actinoplanes sp. L3-i22]BCY12169.1 TetR family transcriptional regulator [Actinoplanes sp. L3-i22]